MQCENAYVIQHHVLLRIICVFENHSSGVRNVVLACNAGVVILMFTAKSSLLFFALPLHVLLAGYNIICGSLVI